MSLCCISERFKMADDKKLCVVVCGGGNGSHVMAAFAVSRPNTEVRVISLTQDEKWTAAMAGHTLTVDITHNDGSTGSVSGNPSMVTKDPSVAIPGADIIILSIPAFAHEQYFEAIGPYVEPNTIIVGLPGQAGFEHQCLHAMGEVAHRCVIASSETLPFNCRITEFGRRVKIIGFKSYMGFSITMGKSQLEKSPLETIQFVIGTDTRIEEIGNYVAVNLLARSIVHPPIMYGMWSKWDGRPLDGAPLFYQGVNQHQVNLLDGISKECVAAAKQIAEKRPGSNMDLVIPMLPWLILHYGDALKDKSSLLSAMKNNTALAGLKHPMTRLEDGGYVPDFSTRYMTEDVPYGLVVLKGFAEIAGVETPIMDEVITWCQNKLGKEYLIGSELKGKDLGESRCPQRFGYQTLDDLFGII